MLMKSVRAIVLCGAFAVSCGFAVCAESPATLRIMSFNVRHCEGMDNALNIPRTAQAILAEKPDFAGLQEIDCCTKRVQGVNESEELSRLTGLHATFAKAIPFAGGAYGVMLLSREKPLAYRTFPLPGTEKRVLLLCAFTNCVVGTTHLSVSTERERLDSIDLIKKAVASFAKAKPVFITGDWNATIDSPVLKQMARDWTVLSTTREQTFHGHKVTSAVPFCIDYVAVDKVHANQFETLETYVVPNRVASDHAPIVVKLAQKKTTEITLTNSLVSLTFDRAGFVSRLVEHATGRSLVTNRAPFVAVVQGTGERLLAPNQMTQNAAGELVWHFPNVPGEVALAIEPFAGGWTFCVQRVTLRDVRRLFVGGLAGVVCTKWASDDAQCVSDEASGIALRGYELVSTGDYGARVQLVLANDRPFAGRKFGLVAGPRANLCSALQAMTRAAGFPHSTAGGAWTLSSEQCRGSYLNANVTMQNLDDQIALAQLGGFDVVHFRENWYACRGHYPVNTNDFPRGLSDLQAAVAKVHAAGLRAGLHTLTGCIDPRDSWITPRCRHDLMAWTSYTLAADLSAEARELVVNECPIDAHDIVYTYNGNGNVLRVGDELIQYSGIRREKPYAFTGLTRGSFGTVVSLHAKGERTDYLQQRYLAFYPDPDSPLAQELADAIAHVYTTCGFDQIYLDGTEGMRSEYGMAKMRNLIFAACTKDGRPCLVEDSHSGRGAGCWWFHSRKGAWDSTHWAPKRFHDFHVAAIRQDNPRMSAFREVQMGWWCPCAWDPCRRAHADDDIEYYAGKNAALDASMSIAGVNPSCQSYRWLSAAGYGIFRQMTILGWYEHFRRAGVFDPDFRALLAQPRIEARLRQDCDGVWRYQKAQTHLHRVAGKDYARWQLALAQKPQETHLRLETLGNEQTDGTIKPVVGLAVADVAQLVVSNAVGVADVSLKTLPHAEYGPVLALSARNESAPSTGAWVCVQRCYARANYLNVVGRPALAVSVKGDGSGALVNVQASSPREYGLAYTEHYIHLDFTGWRTFVLPFSETDAEEYANYIWPYQFGYASVFHREIKPKAVNAVSIYLNDMQPGKTVNVQLSDVKFVAVCDTILKAPVVTLNGQSFPVPFALRTGEYAEYGKGFWTHLDRERFPLERVPATKPLPFVAGANTLAFTCASASSVERAIPCEARLAVSLFTLGPKMPALTNLQNLTAAQRKWLQYEAAEPVVYAPHRGFGALPDLVMRPGEWAEPTFKVRGPIEAFTMEIGHQKRTFPAVKAHEEFSTSRGTFAPVSGRVPIRITAHTANAWFRFVKHYDVPYPVQK